MPLNPILHSSPVANKEQKNKKIKQTISEVDANKEWMLEEPEKEQRFHFLLHKELCLCQAFSITCSSAKSSCTRLPSRDTSCHGKQKIQPIPSGWCNGCDIGDRRFWNDLYQNIIVTARVPYLFLFQTWQLAPSAIHEIVFCHPLGYF